MRILVLLQVVLLTIALTTDSVTIGADPIMLNPPPELPKYQLSNARVENDRFGRSVMAFDWRRTKEGKGSVSVGLRGKQGRIQSVFGGSLRGDSGTERYQQMFGRSRTSIDIEFWVESPGPAGRKFMISNAVRIGNPGPATRARAMNKEDQAAIAEYNRVNSPPPGLPDGHVLVDAGTRLIPGMLIKAGWEGEWEDAEVLADDGVRNATVLYPHQSETIRLRSKKGWLAITPEMKTQAIRKPDQFRPSVRVLPGTTVKIPLDAVLANNLQSVPVGLPIRYVYGTRLEEGFVVKVVGDKLSVRKASGNSKSDRSVPRKSVVVDSAVAARIKDSSAVAEFAKNVEMKKEDVSGLPLKDYPVKATPPNGYSIIGADTSLKTNSKIKASWGSKWYEMTVLADSQSGPVAVRWDSFGAAWDCRIRRDQLAVETSKNKAAAGGYAGGGEIRTWKDATGKFKIEAKFETVQNGKLVLRTAEGRKIEVPMEKLDATDRAFAEKLMSENEENPFKVR